MSTIANTTVAPTRKPNNYIAYIKACNWTAAKEADKSLVYENWRDQKIAAWKALNPAEVKEKRPRGLKKGQVTTWNLFLTESLAVAKASNDELDYPSFRASLKTAWELVKADKEALDALSIRSKQLSATNYEKLSAKVSV